MKNNQVIGIVVLGVTAAAMFTATAMEITCGTISKAIQASATKKMAKELGNICNVIDLSESEKTEED